MPKIIEGEFDLADLIRVFGEQPGTRKFAAEEVWSLLVRSRDGKATQGKIAGNGIKSGAMACPDCGCGAKVVQANANQGGVLYRRIRQCVECKAQYLTFERFEGRYEPNQGRME
jgi:hypothetical protein